MTQSTERRLNAFYEACVDLKGRSFVNVRSTLSKCVECADSLPEPLTDCQQLHLFRNVDRLLRDDLARENEERKVRGIACRRFREWLQMALQSGGDTLDHKIEALCMQMENPAADVEFHQIIDEDMWDSLHQITIMCPNHRKDLVELFRSDMKHSGVWLDRISKDNMTTLSRFCEPDDVKSAGSTPIPFTMIRHCVHDVENLVAIMEKPDEITLKPRRSQHYDCDLVWTSAVPLGDTPNHLTKSEAFDKVDNRYGCYHIVFPISTVLVPMSKFYGLGSRHFKREVSHTILVSEVKARFIDSMECPNFSHIFTHNSQRGIDALFEISPCIQTSFIV